MSIRKVGEGVEQVGDGILQVGSGVLHAKDMVAHGIAEALGGGKIAKVIINAVNVGTEGYLYGGRYLVGFGANLGKFAGNFLTGRRKTAFTNDLIKAGGAIAGPAIDIVHGTSRIIKEDNLTLKELGLAKYTTSPANARNNGNARNNRNP